MLKSIGFTLGKYAPFHKGHQFVIETASAEMDHIIVLIYDAKEQTSIPLAVRANWIRTIYPQVEVIEGHNGPTAIGNTPEIQRLQENYILKMLGNHNITAFYSSEFYGEHTSKALGAINRQVDPDRAHIPISATRIRSNPKKHQEFLHPIVYQDLIRFGECG
ncbi:MAG: adenylyltransferase/cytidyltransferase family protein [Candidatus Promineifilaceae bacterium]